MLSSRLGTFEGLRVADLFAGSGALGLEALSRGATSATFVERETKALAAIRTNAAAFGATSSVQLLGGSAFALPRSQPFDLILADPPYSAGSGNSAIESVTKAGWLTAGGWLSVETARGDRVTPGELEIDVERDIGSARITLMRRP